MGHKVYISFKTEDVLYKDAVQSWDHLDYVDKSLNAAIESSDRDYVLRVIRQDYLRSSTVTVFLIGKFSAESAGEHEQYFIKKELQASLFDGFDNTKSGILGVVLPEMDGSIFAGDYRCPQCERMHNYVRVGDDTVIREFSYNYYIPNDGCSWSESERYCVLTSWKDFQKDPNGWIDAAFNKRDKPIANKTRVRP